MTSKQLTTLTHETRRESRGFGHLALRAAALLTWLTIPPSAPEAEDCSGGFGGLQAHPGAREAAPQYLQYLPVCPVSPSIAQYCQYSVSGL